MISLIDSAEVKGNKITDLDNLVGCHAMRQSTAYAGGYNRIEGSLFASQGTHIVFQTACQTALGTAGLDILQQMDKGFVSNAGSLQQHVQLFFILNHTDIAEINALHIGFAQKLVQHSIIIIAVIRSVKAYYLRLGILCQISGGSPDAVRTCRSILQHLEELHFVSGLLCITAIRNQHALLSVQIQQTGISCKAGQITDCGNILNNDTVYLQLGHMLQNSIDTRHDITLFP